MTRTRRNIFNSLTVVSLLLMVATVGLWVEGQSHEYLFGYAPGQGADSDSYEIGSTPAGCFVTRYTTPSSDDVSGRERWNFIAFLFEIETVVGSGGPFLRIEGIDVSHWFLTLTFAILPAIWLFKWNKRRKLGPNACSSCGYDLTGNESGVCPECGASSPW